MAYYLGIDPGIKGWLALINDNSEVLGSWPMPLDKARKFCPLETWKLFCQIDDIAANDFEDVVVCLEGLLSLPSDTNKITLMIKMVEKEPTPELFENLYKELKRCDGRTGSVTMGRNHGRLEGQIAAKGWRYIVPSPRSWQSVMNKNSTGPTAKVRSYNTAKALFPNEDLSTGKKNGGFNDGTCDALCLAAYCRKQLR